MRNVLRERFDALPDSQQHLAKAVGFGAGVVASAVYGTLTIRPGREGDYDSGLEAFADGLDASNKSLILLIGMGAMTINAQLEFDEYKRARAREQADVAI